MSKTISKKVKIINELGLHARTAGMIVKIAEKAVSNILIIKDTDDEDNTADATSVVDIISLYCPKGTDIIIQIDHSDDLVVLDEIVQLVKNGFGEQT